MAGLLGGHLESEAIDIWPGLVLAFLAETLPFLANDVVDREGVILGRLILDEIGLRFALLVPGGVTPLMALIASSSSAGA